MTTPRATAKPKSRQRSKVANGTALLPDIDGRSTPARRIRELVSEFVSDMGGDPSGAQLAIARRAATLIAWAEDVEAQLVRGVDIDISAYTTAVNALRRLLTDIGLDRKMRDVTPTLDAYMAAAAAAKTAEAR